MTERAPARFQPWLRFTAALVAEFQQGHQAVRREVDKFKPEKKQRRSIGNIGWKRNQLSFFKKSIIIG